MMKFTIGPEVGGTKSFAALRRCSLLANPEEEARPRLGLLMVLEREYTSLPVMAGVQYLEHM